MLLERIVELGLLEPTAASTISTYPLETQKKIVGECAVVFSAAEHRKLPLNQALDTVNILACGVDFGLEGMQLTMQVVSILSTWLLEPTMILEDAEQQQTLRENILRGLSGLFREKQECKGDFLIGELQSHVDLCRKVLNLFFLLLPQTGSDSTALRIVIGASDYLLGKPLLPYCYLADELADYLTGTLLEIFLKGGEIDKELWDCVGQRFTGWLNRLPVANCWNLAIVALTEAYANTTNQKGVLELSWKGQNVEIVTTREFVKQAWFRLAYFVNDFSKAFPSVVAKVVSGIDKVINLLLPLNTQANTLMALFGKPLAQAVFREDCPDARANALSVLCQVMCRTRSNQVIRPEYLALFYAALRKALKKDRMELVEGEFFSSMMAVLHGEEVLRLQGARVLFDDLLAGCKRIVPRMYGKLNIQYEEEYLRKTTFRLLAQLSVISAHFPFYDAQEIEKILLESLQLEASVENATYLMNILAMHSVAHHHNPNERLEVIKQFVQKIENASVADVATIGISAVTCLTSLISSHPTKLEEEYETLCSIGQKVLKRNDFAQDGKFLSGLLEFLVEHIDVMSGREASVVNLLAQTMGYNQNAPNQPTERHTGLTFLRNEVTLEAHKQEKALKEFAEGQLCRLLHRKQPESEDADLPLQKHYKLFNSSVLSLAIQNKVVQVVIRNRAGRFVWYFENAVSEVQTEGKLFVISKTCPSAPLEEEFHGDIYNDQFTETSFPLDHAFTQEESSEMPSEDITVNFKNNIEKVSEKELGKILLAQLGLTHILLNQRESILQDDPHLLDAIPREKEFACACLFGKSGREEAERLLAANKLSNDYLCFLNNLANPKLSLLVPQELNAVMDSGPLELPNGQPVNANALQAFNYIRNAPIIVLWLEDLEGMTSIPSKLGLEALIYVCICPVMERASDGLYRIRLMVTSEDASVQLLFGPLIDDCLVRREELSKLVRDTIISFSHQHCSENNQMLSRAECIKELKAKAVKVLNDLIQPTLQVSL